MSKSEKAVEGLSPLQQEVLNRADAIVASIRESISKAGEFLMEHLPSLAQEYIAYGRASVTVYVLIGIALLMYAGLNFWLNKSRFEQIKHEVDHSYNDMPGFKNFLYIISLVASGVFGLILVLANLSELLKVWFAPRIWLLENIVNLVKRIS